MSARFHLFLPQMRMSHDAIVERALAAESAGFEGIAFMDHLAPPMAFEHDMWEAMEIAAWVLARTTTLQVGHLVLCDAFRHPSVLARQIVTLDHASGGRFELGIGWGSVPSEFEVFGTGSTEARERVARFGESLEIMRRLWSGESFEFAGEHFTLNGAQQRPVPTRQIPITIGGVGRKTLALVREYADWWNVAIHVLHKVPEMRDQAGDAGLTVQVRVGLLANESEREEVTALATKRFPGSRVGDSLVIGTANELIDHFGARHEQGVQRFYPWFTDFAKPDTLHRFADIIAALDARPE